MIWNFETDGPTDISIALSKPTAVPWYHTPLDLVADKQLVERMESSVNKLYDDLYGS